MFRDGADTETVVCALFHDVGEVMSPVCHGEIGIHFRITNLFLNLTLQRQVCFGHIFRTKTSGSCSIMRSC